MSKFSLYLFIIFIILFHYIIFLVKPEFIHYSFSGWCFYSELNLGWLR